MILEQLANAAKRRTARDQAKIPLERMKRMAEALSQERRFFMERAIGGEDISFICEVKKASPSKGLIAREFPYADIAREYEEAGAACISVLTEPEYFLGSDAYLREIRDTVSIPILRKDFTVDPYMIYQAKVLGADAVLFICALLDTPVLKEYLKIADDLGLSAVIEAHDEAEIASALQAGARIVGVNNRNLKDFTVCVDNSLLLRELVPPEVLFVAESGIRTAADIQRLREHRVNAALIGETLMRSRDKKQMLEELRGTVKRDTAGKESTE